MVPLIKLEEVKKEYLSGKIKTEALKGINLEIGNKEFVSIMGASGSGKSTLMHVIGLLDRPTSGKYFFSNQDTSKFSDNRLAFLRNKKIGFVFQTFNLLPKISVLDNVLLPVLYDKKANFEKAKERAVNILKEVGLGNRIYYKPNELSGGQQQRVAIARALINNPDLILADEPTGNLDSKAGKIIMDIFTDIYKEGKTIVMVTHEENIASYAKRIVIVKDGQILDS